jgi:hypothetical protein
MGLSKARGWPSNAGDFPGDTEGAVTPTFISECEPSVDSRRQLATTCRKVDG